MNQNIDFSHLKEKARKFYKNFEPSHDFSHVERVKKMALRIGKDENADLDILRTAALFHDIGRDREEKGKIECHAEWSAKKTSKILKDEKLDEVFIEKVVDCISAHRYSRGKKPKYQEAKILSDADNLDALGAIGIARVFSFGGSNNVDFKGDNSSLMHLHDKILKLKDRMYTDLGKNIADDRTNFVEKFIERFEDEWEGER